MNHSTHSWKRVCAVAVAAALVMSVLAASSADAQGASDQATCPDGFSLTVDGTTCTRPAEQNPGSLSCEVGTLSDGENPYCFEAAEPGADSSRVAASPIRTTGETIYTCPSGTTAVAGDASLCQQAVTTTETVPPIATTSYSCPAGYDASGSGASMTCTRDVMDELVGSAARDDHIFLSCEL